MKFIYPKLTTPKHIKVIKEFMKYNYLWSGFFTARVLYVSLCKHSPKKLKDRAVELQSIMHFIKNNMVFNRGMLLGDTIYPGQTGIPSFLVCPRLFSGYPLVACPN